MKPKKISEFNQHLTDGAYKHSTVCVPSWWKDWLIETKLFYLILYFFDFELIVPIYFF